MPSKERVLALLEGGYGYPEIADLLRIPAGQAYLIGTGIPADGGDTVTAAARQRPGVLPSHSQLLVNPRGADPGDRARVHDWIRERARAGQSPPAPPAAPAGTGQRG